MKNTLQKLNEFYLKILAIVFMTIDHIGVFLVQYAHQSNFNDPMYITGYVFRCIGRLAFPLFVFMLVEGIMHTKSLKKYLLRIGIIAGGIMIAQIIIYYCFTSDIQVAKSPLIDLFLCALTLGLLKKKNKYSWLSILPISYIVLVTFVTVYEIINKTTVIWLPFYVRPDYSLLGLILSLLFYYSFDFVKIYLKRYRVDQTSIVETPYYRSLVSVYQSIFLIGVNVLLYLLSFVNINGSNPLDIYNASIQTWSIFSVIFFLMFNGKRGYNKKWFQYGTYLYFPVHIVIIFTIFYLIYM